MPDIASVLKVEIARIARKEMKGEIEALKKATAQQRSAIASLKRMAEQLERLVRRASKGLGHAAFAGEMPDVGESTQLRFSAKGFASLRARLGISAAAMGQLLGVSPLSIYKWESGKTRPRATQLPKIAQVRGLGKREVMARLGGGLRTGNDEEASAQTDEPSEREQRTDQTKAARRAKTDKTRKTAKHGRAAKSPHLGARSGKPPMKPKAVKAARRVRAGRRAQEAQAAVAAQ